GRTMVAPCSFGSSGTYVPAKPPPRTSVPPRACASMPISIAPVAIQVAVIGSGREHEARAEEVGRLLAERGCTVVTGGLGEVMAAGGGGGWGGGGVVGRGAPRWRG